MTGMRPPGSHAAGTPRLAPGRCAGRCVPGQSARQYEGQGPMDFAAFTGTPGGMPMAFVRCYTGTDGQSHFEDLDLLPPDMERSIEQAASSITFTRSPNGRFSDWHNAPRRQYAIFLSGGQMEVVIGDGTTRRFGPGERRPVRRPHGTRAHQPERRWGPPDRYRALSGLASSRGSCTRWRRIMISSRKPGRSCSLEAIDRPRCVSHQQGAYSRESEG